MPNSKTALFNAKIAYFFKETFRAHSKAEYKEIFSRGLNDDNGGVSGTMPWLYARAFFVFLVIFILNILLMRITESTMYIPSVVFLGGITFTIPFIILLYEAYPKRDISLFLVMGLLLLLGTLSAVCTDVLHELIYNLTFTHNKWVDPFITAAIEETSKAIPAMLAIVLLKQKNPYAGFLIGASVGAGFSVIEDMGYIFEYGKAVVGTNVILDASQTVSIFLDRGFSSFCSHIIWTGEIGWAFCVVKTPFKSLSFPAMLLLSISLHSVWNLPLKGWWQVLSVGSCIITGAALNIAVVHLSRIKTLSAEVDLTAVNMRIIAEAKQMGERLRFTNAANLTYCLMWLVLSVLVLLVCAMPIGVDYVKQDFSSPEEFINFIQDEREFDINLNRQMKYIGDESTYELRYIDGEPSYAVQVDKAGNYEYYYGYFINGNAPFYTGTLDEISVGIVDDNGVWQRYDTDVYYLNGASYIAVNINDDILVSYKANKDNTVTAVLNSQGFEGYDDLLAICITGVTVTAACFLIIISLRLKIRRIKDA